MATRTVKRKEKERKGIGLEIEMEDFGPISNGKIALKPLTLFIGPNNSGKSYAAMLVHSIFESYVPMSMFESFIPTTYFERRRVAEDTGLLISTETFFRTRRQITLPKVGEELEVPKQLIEEIVGEILHEVYEERLAAEIIRSYACQPNDLIRIGINLFGLRINFDSYGAHLTYQEGKFKIKEFSQLDVGIRIKATGKLIRPSEKFRFDVKRQGKKVLIEISGILAEKELALSGLAGSIFEICVSQIFEVAMPCYYLPAARSGILQGHKALVASIVKKSPYIGIEKLEIPKFSGVVSDFISSVITLPEDKGPFYRLAQSFEKELIKGEIVVRTPDEYRYPEIKYSFQDTEIPLHRTSSTVSELAPLFLYLKYIIKPESILIIEEPEAHLHPGNQRILAKYLVRLVREGVNVIITTHSEYLLEQLNNFFLLSKVKPEERTERYGYSKDDFLKLDEIAVYEFHPDMVSGGHKITEVEITEEDGISQEEFVKIYEALYEQTSRLRRDLSDEA